MEVAVSVFVGLSSIHHSLSFSACILISNGSLRAPICCTGQAGATSSARFGNLYRSAQNETGARRGGGPMLRFCQIRTVASCKRRDRGRQERRISLSLSIRGK